MQPAESPVEFFLIAFISVFVVINPIGAVPAFAALTRGRSLAETARIARRGTTVAAIVLAAFTVLGGTVLRVLGVGPDAFQLAGGVLLFLTALEMLRGKAPACGCGPADIELARERDDIAIVPVAIPLLAGPGSMATVMSLVSRASGGSSVLAVLAAIAVTLLVAYPILRGAGLVQRLVGASALTVVQRVLGLVLAALSIQTGVTALVRLLTTLGA
jgi:multiple antibiotic resistance protein